jgi:hypothetical protein
MVIFNLGELWCGKSLSSDDYRPTPPENNPLTILINQICEEFILFTCQTNCQRGFDQSSFVSCDDCVSIIVSVCLSC